MKYVAYVKNQFCLTGREYLHLLGDEVYGLHQPTNAQRFETKKEARDTLEPALDGQEVKVVKYQKAVEHHEENCLKPYRVRKSLASSRPYKGERREELIQFWIDYYKNGTPIKQEHFYQWPDLYMDYHHIFGICPFPKNKIGFVLRTERDGDFDVFLEELKIAMKYSDMVEDGKHTFDIFDHRLGECGDHAWLVTDGTMGMIRERYGSDSSWMPIKDCFDHIRRDCYYE